MRKRGQKEYKISKMGNIGFKDILGMTMSICLFTHDNFLLVTRLHRIESFDIVLDGRAS